MKKKVINRVPQGSVLALIMFAVYINYMTIGANSSTSLFADGAKLFRKVNKVENWEALLQDLNKIQQLSCKCKMEFNAKKLALWRWEKKKDELTTTKLEMRA